MQQIKNVAFGKADWLIALVLAVVSAIVYGLSMASFAYPGESAHLMVVWQGLDAAVSMPYPLMAQIARFLGCGNAIAPICGVISVVAVYLLISFFVRMRTYGEASQAHATSAGRLAGLVAAVVFMLTPSVRAAATHLEPRLFDFTWAMLCALLPIAWLRITRWQWLLDYLFPIVIGMAWGVGCVDSALFVVLSPLMLAALVIVSQKKGRSVVTLVSFFAIVAVVIFLLFASDSGTIFGTLRMLMQQLRGYVKTDGWLAVVLLATVPFVVSIFASAKSFNEKGDWMQWAFNLGLGVVSIVAIATPLSPSTRMEPYGILPVTSSAFVAAVAGYLAAYWWLQARVKPIVNESKDIVADGRGRIFAYIGGGLLAVVYLFTCAFNLFSFDAMRGSFADRLAEKVIDDLGDRKWLVSDGTLDDHLRLVASRRNIELNLISLNRDLDRSYLSSLAELVREKGLAGDRNAELSLSLSLGVLPFVQDWFSFDPQAAKSVAVFGAPDLWYSAGLKPVPEFLFFGSDPERKPDWKQWKEFAEILHAPKEWGSFKVGQTKNPVDKMRFEMRRHMGLVANNRGVWLQEQGRDDEAFDMYELVLSDIDVDNVCALFNLFEMARAKYARALAKKNDLERRLRSIVDDPSRRYRLWALSNYYGYIRNPEIFIRLGFTWARSGRPGDALTQIRRAIDFIPTDRRSSLLNMMAALYASEDERAKSREVYEEVLAKNANDHDALVGMMRLSLLDGDSEKALNYLERATGVGGDDPRVQIELAMLALMKNELEKSRKILSAVTDANASDLRAWSLLAAVTMQMCDATKDTKRKLSLERDLEDRILPTMEKQARSPYDYYVQTTRAFLYLRKGVERRRAARDAFVVAAKARPDVAATQDLVLGLDISLDDAESAERHAMDVLRRNRKAPLANYVMGSLALRKNDLALAEQYLRKAADAKRPVVLAMNDLAEVYRRQNRFDEGERYARLAVRTEPNLYVAWETLGSILMGRQGDLAEAQKCIEKACELSKVDGREEDIRMLISLARVQIARGERKIGRVTLRKVQSRLGELSEYERKEYETLLKDVR